MKKAKHMVTNGLVLAAVLCLTATAVHAQDPKELWDSVKAKWNNDINSYDAQIFAWGWRTPQWIENRPDICPPEDKCEPHWRHRIYHARFKKPMQFLFSYEYAINEDTDTTNIIDKAVSYVFMYVPGTLLNYGVKDDERVYVKMPYISDEKWQHVPVGAVDRGAMRLLLIASRSEIYYKLLEELPDPRGYYPTDLAIGNAMSHFEHYFTEGAITVSRAPNYIREDFVLNERSGFMTVKDKSGDEHIKLTMVPNDVDTNKGISKVEIFIDPKINMFVGLHEYEKMRGQDTLMGVLRFMDLKLNADIPDSEFLEKFFENRKISETGRDD